MSPITLRQISQFAAEFPILLAIRIGSMSKHWLVAAGLVVATLFGTTGCGPSGPKTHVVKGQVQLPGGDIKVLAGHALQVIQESNPQVQAYGEIKPDGGFALETYDKGEIRKGAYEGKYKARIVLADDDAEIRAQAARAVPPAYLQFETSGLTIEVPAKSDVKLPLVRR
jgi:hypothetical protein